MDKPTWDERMADWESNPKLRAMTDQILSMPVEDRLRQIEAEANFFAAVKSLDD